MDKVVYQADIVRLVHGYLINKKLNEAATALCETSPYLAEERNALQNGVLKHNFLNHGLEEIIREHVRITDIIAKKVQGLSSLKRMKISDLVLSKRVDKLLKNEARSPTGGTHTTDRSINRKRRRQYREQRSSHFDERSSTDDANTATRPKRRRLLLEHILCNTESRPGTFLDGRTTNNESSDDFESSIMSSCDEKSARMSYRNPKNNSTPLLNVATKSIDLITPKMISDLIQTILRNPDFQSKLGNNINMALKSISASSDITSETLLQSIIKNVIETTQKDPCFQQVVKHAIRKLHLAPNESKSIPPISCNALVADVADAEPPISDVPATPLIIRSAVPSVTTAAPNVALPNQQQSQQEEPRAEDNQPPQPQSQGQQQPQLQPQQQPPQQTQQQPQEQQQQQQSSDFDNISINTENLISFTDGILTAQEEAQAQEFAMGQMFPMYLTNDGMISQLPYIENVEWVTTSESITVTTNQLPLNSVIVGSVQKQSADWTNEYFQSQPKMVITEIPSNNQESQENNNSAENNTSTNDLNNSVNNNGTKTISEIANPTVPASLDSSRIHLERATLSTPSSLVNIKAMKSMSTPRKRNSHVRALTFSPKNRSVQSNQSSQQKPNIPPTTPVTTSCEISMKRSLVKEIAQETANITTAKQLDKEAESEKPVINKVEIIPNIVNAMGDVSANDSSNGSVPPMFAMEECSNQTVIQAKKTESSFMPPTPMRKQKRGAVVNACKRIISQTGLMDEPDEQSAKAKEKTSLKNDNDEAGKENNVSQMNDGNNNDDLMNAWQRQMHSTNEDLEERLRAINAERIENDHTKTVRPRRSRRSTAGSKKKAKLKDKQKAQSESEKVKQTQTPEKKSTKRTKKKGGEFNIKITPHKVPRSTEKKASKMPKETEENHTNTTDIQVQSIVQSDASKLLIADQAKRTKNIAYLLDTPFKEVNLTSIGSGQLPPTPGMMIMPMDTPSSKLSLSNSFLFGSDTKSIIDTPMLNAITPGLRWTPHGLSQNTPRSAAKTDYSSGSSYYRPDESEHTDTNAQYELQSYGKPEIVQPSLEMVQSQLITATLDILKPQKAQEEVACFELAAERLPVEPTVLHRVRSFGSEAVDSMESAKLNLDMGLMEAHYKLVGGLPDVMANVEYNSRHSSSSSSTSSSSSSSSSSNDSSDSSSSTTTRSSKYSVKNMVPPSKSLLCLDPQSLSDISSAEDEEWIKATISENPVPPIVNVEPALLVNQDGEVRYPLRNWLTPNKEPCNELNLSGESIGSIKPVHAIDTIKFTMPLKSAEKLQQKLNEATAVTSAAIDAKTDTTIQQQLSNLAVVRERVKNKMRNSTEVTQKSKRLSSTSVSSTRRKLTAMREKGKTAKQSIAAPSVKANQSSPQLPDTAVTTKLKLMTPTAPTERDLELLKALNLSAKKKYPESLKDTLPKSSVQSIKAQTLNSPSGSTTVGRRTLPIEPQPARKYKRSGAQAAPSAVATTKAGEIIPKKRRGRPPRSTLISEPSRLSTRRSTRHVDNQTNNETPNSNTNIDKPVVESGPVVPKASRKRSDSTKSVQSSKPKEEKNQQPQSKSKVARKPAKKRAEARIEQSPVNDAEPQVKCRNTSTYTQTVPEVNVPQCENSSTNGLTTSNGAVEPTKWREFDMCTAEDVAANIVGIVYGNNGPSVKKKRENEKDSFSSESHIKKYQMCLLTDTGPHQIQFQPSLTLLHDSFPSVVTSPPIRNIPKKRIIQFSSPLPVQSASVLNDGGGVSVPAAASTPLPQSRIVNENTMEVAAINLQAENKESERQPDLDGNVAGEVEIEDIESILSHLHGT